MIRIELPFPPSTNNLFVNAGKKRVVSQRYHDWRAKAYLSALEQGWRPSKKILGQVSISIGMNRPDKRKRDLDNLIKPVLDFLVWIQAIEDDSRVAKISIQWADGDFECAALVQPFEEGLAA